MGNELEKIEAQKQYATLISQANLLPRAYQRQPANVLVAMAMGEALDLKPIEAINTINVINGKPALSAELMGALVRRAGHKLRVEVTKKPPSATATLIRKDDPGFEYKVTWDTEAAKTAGLLESTPSWRNYPDQMMRARAITEVCRMGAPDALAGFVYTAEELGGEPQDPLSGPVIEVEEVPEPTEDAPKTGKIVWQELTPEEMENVQYVAVAEVVEETSSEDTEKPAQSVETSKDAAEAGGVVKEPEKPVSVDETTGEILDPLDADREKQISLAVEWAGVLNITPENMQKSAVWVMRGDAPKGQWDTWPPRAIEAVWRGWKAEAEKRGLVDSKAE